MKRHAVLTAAGRDRVGIVDDISAAILEHSCNIEESRMALLGGEFVSILLVSGENDELQRFLGELPALGKRLGLVMEQRSTEPPRVDSGERPYLIESISLDTPGIVHAVTSILRRHTINIHDLETETSSAPWTGAAMFVMKARLSIPANVSVKKLRTELDELSLEHDLDITLQAISVNPAEI